MQVATKLVRSQTACGLFMGVHLSKLRNPDFLNEVILAARNKRHLWVTCINPNTVVACHRNRLLREALTRIHMILADGTGVDLAAMWALQVILAFAKAGMLVGVVASLASLMAKEDPSLPHLYRISSRANKALEYNLVDARKPEKVFPKRPA